MSAYKDRLIQAAELLDMDPDDLLDKLNPGDTFPVGTIDPDGLLIRIRNLLDDYRIAAAANDPTDRAAGFLVADVERMDRHLSGGGDLPAGWDREQRERFPFYKVGDPDPTPDDGPWCRAEAKPGDPNGYYCTWAQGHGHPQHVAGNTYRVVAVWPR
jgi:hypothetical protein